MSLYEIRTDKLTVGTFADDENDALEKAIDLLPPDAEGNIEAVEIEEVEDYEPEGPG